MQTMIASQPFGSNENYVMTFILLLSGDVAVHSANKHFEEFVSGT